MARCGVSGLTHDFLKYDGSSPNVAESCGSGSSDFLMKLCETFLKHMNFKVYFDNWFTSFELQILLKSWGIWSVGKIRTNHLRNCSLKSESELKKEGRDAMGVRYKKQTGISVVHWLDSCTVQLSVTHVGVEPLSTIKRWDLIQKKYIQVICPAIVREYNHHMVGVTFLTC